MSRWSRACDQSALLGADQQLPAPRHRDPTAAAASTSSSHAAGDTDPGGRPLAPQRSDETYRTVSSRSWYPHRHGCRPARPAAGARRVLARRREECWSVLRARSMNRATGPAGCRPAAGSSGRAITASPRRAPTPRRHDGARSHCSASTRVYYVRYTAQRTDRFGSAIPAKTKPMASRSVPGQLTASSSTRCRCPARRPKQDRPITATAAAGGFVALVCLPRSTTRQPKQRDPERALGPVDVWPRNIEHGHARAKRPILASYCGKTPERDSDRVGHDKHATLNPAHWRHTASTSASRASRASSSHPPTA